VCDASNPSKANDLAKSKPQLVAELADLRRQIEELSHRVGGADPAAERGFNGPGKSFIPRGSVPHAKPVESDPGVGLAAADRIELPQHPFQATFEQAAVGILHLRRDGRSIRANRAACDLLASAEEELGAKDILQWVHPADRETFQAALDEVWNEEVSACAINARLAGRGGEHVWGQVSFSLARGRPGGARFLLAIISEITRQKQAERALRESRERLRAVVSNAPIIFWALDRDGQITVVEGAGLQALELQPSQVLGNNVFEVYSGIPSLEEAARKALAGTPGIARVEIKDMVFESRFSPIRDDRGLLAGVIGVATDITPRAQAEAALREAHVELEKRVAERTRELSRANRDLKHEITERKRAVEAVLQQTRILQSVLDSVGDGIVVCDEQARFLLFNPAAGEILGIGLTDAAQADWSARYGLYLPDQSTPFPADALPLSRALRGEIVDDADIFVQHEELSEGKWISVNARPLKDEFGRACGAVAAFRNVTEEKKAREKLRAEQRLLENSLAVHERDRQLMAYELHDGLVQYVTGALMHMEAVRGKLESAGAGIDDKCELVVKLLRQAIVEGRRLISGLRPPILDELGVVAAIAHLVDEQSGDDGPEVLFVHDVQSERMSPLLEGTLYRIVQEALANVKKHSQAETARVELTQQGESLRLAVTDTGVGFDPQAVPDSRYGLQGIRRRAELLHGHASIDSLPGGGTRVVVILPVSIAAAQ